MEPSNIIKYSLIKKGILKHKRNPGLIPIKNLETSIKHCKNLHKLAASIAYSMCYEVKERTKEEWITVFNSYITMPDKFWKDIAVYSIKENALTFSDLICIDYKVLRREKRKEFLEKNFQFKEILLLELKLLGNGRS